MSLRFSKLDRPSIRRLKPGEKLIEHGITAERLSDGDLRYSVNLMVDGKRIHRVIGKESEGLTRTQCEEFIEWARSEARAGRVSLPKGRKLALTFTAAADDYVNRLDESAGKNITIKRRHLRMYLKPFFRPDAARRYYPLHNRPLQKKRQSEEAANATINRELATFSHLLSMAIEWKWLDRALSRPRMLAEAAGRIIALTDVQCDALMTASVESADPYCWLFVAFGLNTAMRHSEILATRFDRLDLERLRLFIPDAKAGQREQPITPELAAMLRIEREMRDDREGWIFPHCIPIAGRASRTDGQRISRRRGRRRARSQAHDAACDAPHRDYRACASWG